ncbi:hypothetical protein P171DRAFT_407317 [Karstenula rhodostoma CBS 690.94]|uniref:Alcohol acetyltransferase n=1 Tax=Karstenula rhodostoma CBS 690.94 TaxID=1392251 RepID=A0A9P4PTG8_9PLEO|nr:hypothetical protein P171DRAFT_407317 [Karstenula rhodostoma CBS 690.94]
MSEEAGLEMLRPCGRLELFSTARHHLGYFKNIACAATYTTTSAVKPGGLEGIVWRALHEVIARHPMLSAIVLNEDKQDSEVYFARLPSIDLRTCVEFIERQHGVTAGGKDEELELALQKQHKINLRENIGSKPFWRLVILHHPEDQSSFTAVWFFHHALGDGGCGPIFHRSLLSALNISITEDAVDPVVKPPSTPILPKFEDLHPHPISWRFFLRAILGSIFPSIFAPRPSKLWTGPPITAPTPLPDTKLHLLALSAPTTTRLRELSRENKTTLQATLECCIACALFSVLPAETYDKVKASGPISTRSLIRHEGKPVGDDDFVLALAEYTHLHERASHALPSDEFPWAEACAVRSSIQTEIAKKGADNVISLLRYVSDMHKYLTEKTGEERSVSFELSNLGLVKAEAGAGDGWKLGRCVFSQSANMTGPPIVCSAVTGGDGCCVLTFGWLEGVVTDEMVRGVVDAVERQIQGLVGGSC